MSAATTGRERWAPGIRGMTAIVFIAFGVGKFTSHASELASFQQYGLPAPDAFVYVIGVLEIAGGLLLALGLLVRPAALALAGDMIGAIVVSGVGRGETVSLTLAPAMLVAMGFLVVAGAGGWSLDRRLAEDRGRGGGWRPATGTPRAAAATVKPPAPDKDPDRGCA